MSHAGTGFFYYRYTYHCPWTNQASNTTGTDDSFHSAVYTPVMKQDHAAQSMWLKNSAMPAIQADLRKWYADVDRNKLGRNYERFNQAYIKEQDFMYCKKMPQHTTGPLKGKPFGKQV